MILLLLKKRHSSCAFGWKLSSISPLHEKVYVVGSPEFEELQGHGLVMLKALYGTRCGGACWHDKHFDIHHQMGFKSSKADSDIWMKSSKDDNHFEYIAVYVED